MSTEQKTYKRLCDEKEGILDEMEKYKQGLTYGRMGLCKNKSYTYLDELAYILVRVEEEILAYKIILKKTTIDI